MTTFETQFIEHLSLKLNIEHFKVVEVLHTFKLAQELWLPVEGFNNYEISSGGRVKNVKTGAILKGWVSKDIITVQLCNNREKKEIAIRLLVATYFVENPLNFKFIKHVDSDKFNNHCLNLEWISSPYLSNKQNLYIDTNEKWKVITGNEKYEVSDKGNIRNKNNLYIMKSSISEDGYHVIHLSRGNNSQLIHVLVAKEFVDNPENKPSVDHIDRNKGNNHASNLRWATSKEQCKNRTYTGKGVSFQKYKIIRENRDGTNAVVYDNIEKVIDFILENNLSTASRRSITTNLKKPLLKFEHAPGRVCKSSYGYIWKYAPLDLIEGEIWLSVKMLFPTALDYKISTFGRVQSPIDRILTGALNGGYRSISLGLNGKHYKIHRLVAKLFIPNPLNKKCVNHIDGNKTNNNVTNLEWVTHAENAQHAVDTGLNPGHKS